ncbi:hypothetical protein B0H16DRAFT_1454892 [Mycena metata]|uniref:F-box domain-containing protein n=1 Tax=Mycena metata TaxID=1033252 RepID=A0AAD7JIW0_9AGAR|nr:hypothetical protein B0H16DRAFT_1454892 [Mycena metata]
MNAALVVSVLLWASGLGLCVAAGVPDAALFSLVSSATAAAREGISSFAASQASSSQGIRALGLFLLFDCLPLELVIAILVFACGRYRSCRRTFLYTRRCISHTCQRWRFLVHSVSDFWTALTVTPHARVSEVNDWISHWRTGLLDLRLQFDTLYSLYYSPSTDDERRMFPRRTVSVFAPFFSRCARLSLVLEDYRALPQVLRRLRRASANHLVSFAIRRVTLPFVLAPVHGSVRKPRRLFSGSGFPRLKCLLLDNATVGWNDSRYYAGLDDFVLRNVGAELELTPALLCSILCWASKLCRLLHTLDLHLDGSVSIARILSVCRMPALSSLSVFVPVGQDLVLMLQCASSMTSITSLTINGASTDLTAISRLYSHFPLLTVLDVSLASPQFCYALFDMRREDPHLCPALQELRVVDVPLLRLRTLLEARTAASLPVSRLTMCRVFNLVETDNDIQWFFDTYEEEDLIIDPEPTFERKTPFHCLFSFPPPSFPTPSLPPLQRKYRKMEDEPEIVPVEKKKKKKTCLLLLPFTKGKKPWWCLRVQPFPEDLWIELILVYCGLGNTTKDFALRRNAICYAAPEIEALILDRPLMWSRVYLGLDTYEEDLAMELALSSGSDLRVEIDLRAPHSHLGFCDLSGLLIKRPYDLHRSLDHLRKVSFRWINLVIKVDGPRTLIIVKDFLASAYAPFLVTAILESSYSGRQPMPEALGGALHHLTALRITSFPVRWLKCSNFKSLRHLDIKTLTPFDRPSQYDFTVVLEQISQTLERLSVTANGVVYSPSFTPGCFIMERLQRLELVFFTVDPIQTGLLISVLGSLGAPSLTHFRLVNCDSISTLTIAQELLFLRSVTQLILSGGAATVGSASALLRSMSSLSLADLSTAPASYTTVLAARPDHWPHLVSVACSPDSLPSILAYAAGRHLFGLSAMHAVSCMYHPRIGFGAADVLLLNRLRVVVGRVIEAPLMIGG